MASTAGDLRSWTVIGGLVTAVAVQPLGCDAPSGQTGLSEAVVVAIDAYTDAVATEAVVPALSDAQAAFDALQTAVGAWQANADATTLAAAQDAWRDAFDAWQMVEPMQLGPQAPSLTALGGEDVRDAIYAWPSVNACRVDQATVNGGWDDDAFYAASNLNAFGLDALEVLLFAPTDDNRCPGQVAINSDGTWDALGEDGVVSARGDYAVALAAHLVQQVDDLVDAWDPSEGNYGALLAGYGTEGSPYATPLDALNALFDAAFYIETRVKDRKVAPAVGRRDCSADSCVEGVEAQWADASVDAIAANLIGVRAILQPTDDAGMASVLEAAGVPDAWADLSDALDAADAAIATLDAPLEDAATSQRADVEALHDALTRFTTIFKSDVAPNLNLQIPSEAAGDND